MNLDTVYAQCRVNPCFLWFFFTLGIHVLNNILQIAKQNVQRAPVDETIMMKKHSDRIQMNTLLESCFLIENPWAPTSCT